jgi:sugar phosphate isomerase/epimerase
MPLISRRHFLATTAAAPLAGAFTKPINLQLYTLRNILPKDPRGVLAEVAKIGYQSVEPGRGALAQLSPICRELKLTTPSVHVETPLVTGNWEAWKGLKQTMRAGYDLARAIDDSKAQGARFLVVSYLQQAERTIGGLDFYRKFADQMNAAGEQSRKAGLQLCYHHHSFEFDPAAGQRPFEILIERFDKKAVMFQADIFWMKIGGQDVVALLNRLKGRVASVHLKDFKAGTATEYNEGKVPKDAFQEVGSGSLDTPAILKTCAAIGVDQYIVEQDQCPGSPIDSIRKSYQYLRSV